ncbi:hypothetical protein JCM3765_007905 [Sporobolomyces pararoseus]
MVSPSPPRSSTNLEVRSRSTAPIPPTPSPRKPFIPSPTPSSHQLAPVDHREETVDLKPHISKSPSPRSRSRSSLSTSSSATSSWKVQTSSAYRNRSQAPEFEPTPPGWLQTRIKLEEELGIETSAGWFEREPTWIETGGGYEEEEPEELKKFETSSRFGWEEEEEGGEGIEHGGEDEEREIDYGDDDESAAGEPGQLLVEREETEEDEEEQEIDAKSEERSESEDEDEPRRRAKKKRARNGSASMFKKRKRLSDKALERIQRNQEAQDQAEREIETSCFLDSLGVDPRPTLVSVKARLTNEVAAKTAHFPAPHQVLSVKEPPLQYPRPPSPPTLGRRHGSTVEPKEASATPGIGLREFNEDDELADYVEDLDQPPPEELIDSKPVLVEFEVVEEEPKRLETKGEAIMRWKEETNLLTTQARPMPDAYSWSSYRRDHRDLSSLSLHLSSPLPPLLTLNRTLEAHQDLLNLRPSSSHTSLVWNSIFDPEPPKIDSVSRQARANWQLSNYRDTVGVEKLLKQAEQEGIVEKDLEMAAKEVFEFDGTDGIELEIVKDRNWLFTEQIIQLARIKKAYARLATSEVLDKLASTLKTKREDFERETNKVKTERSSLPKTIGNSQWILKLGRKIEEMKTEYEITIDKVKRLEENLQARLDAA